MNKQELIDMTKRERDRWKTNNNNNNDYEKGRYLGMVEMLKGVEKLDEPEMPVIPQFIADIIIQAGTNIDRNKEYVIRSTISQFYANDFESSVWEWFNTKGNLIVFIRSVENGYTIEKEPRWVIKIGKGYFSGYEETKVTYVLDDMPGALDERVIYENKEEARAVKDVIGGIIEEVTG